VTGGGAIGRLPPDGGVTKMVHVAFFVGARL